MYILDSAVCASFAHTYSPVCTKNHMKQNGGYLYTLRQGLLLYVQKLDKFVIHL